MPPHWQSDTVQQQLKHAQKLSRAGGSGYGIKPKSIKLMEKTKSSHHAHSPLGLSRAM
jgi:hypothetical protein